MTKEQAQAKLSGMVEADSVPKLSPAEVETILDDHIRAEVFAPDGVYSTGDCILPPGADPLAPGVCYVVVSGGIASSTGSPVFPKQPGITVASGTVEIRFLGKYDGCQWDLRGAARKGWEKKVGKAAKMHDFKSADQSFDVSQIHAHCIEQRDSFAGEYK